MDKMMNNPWFLRITALILAIALFISVRSEIESDNKMQVVMMLMSFVISL